MHNARGLKLIDVVLVFIITSFAALLLYSFVGNRPREAGTPRPCVPRELLIALQMYWSDYDGMLPSSALRQKGDKRVWNPADSASFCYERGPVTPDEGVGLDSVTYYKLLWPNMKNKIVGWCTYDKNSNHWESRDRTVQMSYIYKPAVDCAWFGASYPANPYIPGENPSVKSFRRNTDFRIPDKQIIFFERDSFHTPIRNQGWRDDVMLHAVCLDGHIVFSRVADWVDCDAPETTDELAKIIHKGGEPMWYNYDKSKSSSPSYNGERERLVDPRVCYDKLK